MSLKTPTAMRFARHAGLAKAAGFTMMAGFTMVELMIAMALGLVIVLVVSQVFLSSKESYTTTEELSRLQENARFGLASIGRVARQAGFVTNPANITGIGLAPTIYTAAVRPIDGTEGASSASDTLTVRFQGSGSPGADGTVLDCLGNQIAANAMAVNLYYIANDPDGRPALFCDNVGTVGPATTGPVLLVPNVERMQVLYGEDTNADYSAEYYVVRDDVTDIDKVRSVRVSLLFSSNDFVASIADVKDYAVLNTTYTAPGDRRLRRVYTTTITLRNRVQ